MDTITFCVDTFNDSGKVAVPAGTYHLVSDSPRGYWVQLTDSLLVFVNSGCGRPYFG